jgi:hypothetical protein
MYHENIDGTLMTIESANHPYVGYISGGNVVNYQVAVSDKIMYEDLEYTSTLLLPYEYQLRYDHYDNSSNPAANIKICYLNGDEVQGAVFKLEYGDSSMWEDYDTNGSSMSYRYDSNISWDAVVQTVPTHRIRILLPEYMCFKDTTFCVKYNRVKKVSEGAGIDKTVDVTFGHVEIINPQPIYVYGDDYTYTGGTITRNPSGKLPASGVYVKHADVNRIRVRTGINNGDSAWYLKVQCGSFDRAGDTYEVPEGYAKQYAAVDWSTVGKSVIDPRCSFMVQGVVYQLDKYTLKIPETPLYFVDSNYPDYTPYNVHDALLYPIGDVGSESVYSKGINVYMNNNIVSNTMIVDVDLWNGIIVYNSELTVTDQITATYLYKQLYWTMQLPDLCPFHNHTLFNTDEINGPYLGYNDSVVVCILPSGSYYNVNESIVWYIKSSNPDDVYDGSKKGYSSVRYASVPSVPDVPLVTGTIKLAEVSIKYFNTSMVDIYDARVRGGGIHKDKHIYVNRGKSVTRENINDESNNYADIGLYDGQYLRKSNVLIIKVPYSRIDAVKEDIMLTDTTITDNEAYRSAMTIIKDYIGNYVAAGTYFILVDENNEIYPLST